MLIDLAFKNRALMCALRATPSRVFKTMIPKYSYCSTCFIATPETCNERFFPHDLEKDLSNIVALVLLVFIHSLLKDNQLVTLYI